MSSEKSFTLIELLIVIGIVAVLAAVVVLILNPAQFMAQARDSRRLDELQTLNKAISIYLATGHTYLGETNTVYVSIPDSNSACANLGLPALPSGWYYHCSNADDYRKVDSTGWIPIDFTSISFGSPLNILPIDPENSTSTGQYYTYVIGGSYELNAILESQKYRENIKITKNNLPGVLAVGTNLNLSPIYNTKGLVGYWKFDEGSGTTAYDSSGYNNNGTLYNNPTWTTGKVGGALSFDGVNEYVDAGNRESFNMSNAITIAAWIYPRYSGNNEQLIIYKGGPGLNTTGWRVGTKYGYIRIHYFDGSEQRSITNISYSPNQWYHIVFSGLVDGGMKAYLNGVVQPTTSGFTNGLTTNALNLNIGRYSLGSYYFDGLIDEVRIYNRALSDAEIAAIYNATK